MAFENHRAEKAAVKADLLRKEISDEKFDSAFSWLATPFNLFGKDQRSAVSFLIAADGDYEFRSNRANMIENMGSAMYDIMNRRKARELPRITRIADLLLDSGRDGRNQRPDMTRHVFQIIPYLLQIRRQVETQADTDNLAPALNNCAASILKNMLSQQYMVGDTGRYTSLVTALAPLDGRFALQVVESLSGEGIDGKAFARAVLPVLPQALITRTGEMPRNVFPALMKHAAGDPDLQGEIVQTFINLASSPYVDNTSRTLLVEQIRAAAKEDPKSAGLYREVAISAPDPAAKAVTLVFYKAAQTQTVIAVQNNAFVGSPQEYGRFVEDAYRSLPENNASRAHHFNLRAMIDSSDLAQRMESAPSLYDVFMLNARTKARSWTTPPDITPTTPGI